MIGKIAAFFSRPLSQAGKKTYEKGMELMASMEKSYAEDARALGYTGTSKQGIFQSRLFGANFAVSAMTLSLGEGERKESERVYLALLKKAGQGLGIGPDEVRRVSMGLLKEQTRALNAEMRNVGSGQFALAALYEAALDDSRAPADPPLDPGAAMKILGKRAAEMLGEWAALYAGLAGKPMQTYSLGFKKSPRDAQRLGDA